MTRYELFLFLHVLAAAAWFGAALLSLLLLELSSRAGETAWLVKFGEFDDMLAKLLFIPAALVVLVAGLVLTFDGAWSFSDDGWLTLGLVLFAAIFALGIGLIVPAGQKLLAAARGGATAEELAPTVQRLRLLSWIDVGALAVVIFLMTVKPL